VVEFRGKYEHSIDDRGRVSLPARYRNEFAERIILTMSADGCIEVYTEDGFNQVASHVTVEPPTTPEGRRLRQLAAVDGTVVIAGRKECLEIWNPRRLEEVSGDVAAAPSTEQAPEV